MCRTLAWTGDTAPNPNRTTIAAVSALSGFSIKDRSLNQTDFAYVVSCIDGAAEPSFSAALRIDGLLGRTVDAACCRIGINNPSLVSILIICGCFVSSAQS